MNKSYKKRLIIILLLLVVIVSSAAYFYMRSSQNVEPVVIDNSTKNKIDNVVIIMEENKTSSSLLGNPSASYINGLVNSGSIAMNYHAIGKNPYIAVTSGATTSIKNSCNPLLARCDLNVNNVTKEIDDSGRTWKMYAESMSYPCDFKDFKNYAVRHNPFLFYSKINQDQKYCAQHIVPFTQFMKELEDSHLPNYSFISPNLCNDMHNCPIRIGDKWLSTVVPKILSSTQFKRQRSLLVITWDEGSLYDNKVLTIFLGPVAKSGYTSTRYYTHYSLLHTIEYLWNLKPLTKHDKNSAIMTDMLYL